MNSFWNPEDKRMFRLRHQIINDCSIKHITKQKEKEKIFKTKPNQILIRDGNGNLKIVSKTYYLYYTKDDDYDTETEFDKE